MSELILQIYSITLRFLHYSGLCKLAAPFTRGQGLIFTLHQVNDTKCAPFCPNSILKITPAFLEETIQTVLAEGYEIISLDEATTRIKSASTAKPFAVFTLDDGYKDNRDVALPIFEKYNIPFTIYIVSEYSSHEGELWWLALEHIIRQKDEIENPYKKGEVLPARTTAQKYKAFDKIYWPLRHADQSAQRRTIRQMAAENNYDIDQLTKDLIMNWDELRELNKHPLVSLAAHTKSHYAIAKLTEAEAEQQILTGLAHMERELGEKTTHFSFPYGDKTCAGARDFEMLKNMPFQTAVTTRKGVIYKEHKNHLTALPRISLNGDYQRQSYVKTFLSGLPFRIYNKGKKLDVN